MSSWKECKLGEIIEIIGGGTPKTSISEYWNGNIPWLSVVDFNTGKKNSLTTLSYSNISDKSFLTDFSIVSSFMLFLQSLHL